MPLTFVHPAVVLPLLGAARRARLDLTCLIIGAMAPDFGYFVQGRMHGGSSHTWLGLVTWSLPVTLIVALLFHKLAKWPMLMVAPVRWGRRLVPALAADWPPDQGRRPAFWLAAAVSAVLGAITHLVWDGFTHTEGFIASRIPALLAPVALPLGRSLPLCRVLQHVSTVVGGIVVIVWLWQRAWPAAVELPPVRRARGRLCLAIALVIGLAFAFVHLQMRVWHGYTDPDDWVVATISGGLGGVIAASGVLYRRARAWRRLVKQ